MEVYFFESYTHNVTFRNYKISSFHWEGLRLRHDQEFGLDLFMSYLKKQKLSFMKFEKLEKLRYI